MKDSGAVSGVTPAVAGIVSETGFEVIADKSSAKNPVPVGESVGDGRAEAHCAAEVGVTLSVDAISLSGEAVEVAQGGVLTGPIEG